MTMSPLRGHAIANLFFGLILTFGGFSPFLQKNRRGRSHKNVGGSHIPAHRPLYTNYPMIISSQNKRANGTLFIVSPGEERITVRSWMPAAPIQVPTTGGRCLFCQDAMSSFGWKSGI